MKHIVYTFVTILALLFSSACSSNSSNGDAEQLVVDAGVEKDVVSNHTVSLHGSTNDGHTSLSVDWTQVDDSNITVVLTDADTFNPTFLSPNVSEKTLLTFNMRVTTASFKADDNVTITVLPSVATHVPTSKPITTHSGSTVGVSSNVLPTNPSHTHTHTWTQVTGPTVTLTTSTNPSTTFVAPTVTTPTQVVLQHVVTTTPNNTAQSTTTTTTKHTVHVLTQLTPATPIDVLTTVPSTLHEVSTTTLHVSASGGTAPYTYTWDITAGNAFANLDATDAQNPILIANNVTLNEVVVLQVVVTDGNGDTKTKVVALAIENVEFKIQVSADSTMAGSHTQHLHVLPTTTPLYNPITYNWSEVNGTTATITDATTDNPSVSISGTSGDYFFKVDASDHIGNTATDTIKVEVLDGLAINAGKDFTVIEDTNVTLHALSTGGFGALTIEWLIAKNVVPLSDVTSLNPYFTAPVVTSPRKLIYDLVITDTKGRTMRDRVEVTVNPVLPTVTISAPSSAPLSSTVHATCNVSSGVAPFTYQWTLSGADMVILSSTTDANVTIDISSSASTITPETLTCKVTDAHSRAISADSHLVAYNVPAPVALSVTTSAQNTLIENNLGILSAHVTGGTAPYTYQWSNGTYAGTVINPTQANASFKAPYIAQNSYGVEVKLVVTDAVGSIANAREVITVNNNPLTVTINGPDTIVHGQTIQLSSTVSGGSGNYTYEWNDNIPHFGGTGSTLSFDSSRITSGTTIPMSLRVIDVVNGVTETKYVRHDIVIKSNTINVQFTNPLAPQKASNSTVLTDLLTITNSLPHETFTWSIVETSGITPALKILEVQPGFVNTGEARILLGVDTITKSTTYKFDITMQSSAGRKTTIQTSITVSP